MNISSISSLASHLNGAQPVESNQPAAAKKALIQAVKAVNAAEMFGQDHEVTYTVDRAAGIAVVRLIDKKTGTVLQQIPTEQVLRMAEESSGR